MSESLNAVLDRSTLRHLAGARSFERGVGYFASGAVRGLSEEGGVVSARVRGTREYKVGLWEREGKAGYSCTCPVGADGGFCKHCVAVGLAWLAEGAAEPPAGKKTQKPVTLKDVGTWLGRQEKEVLAELLLEHARQDDRLAQKLFLKVARQSGKGLNLATYRQAIDEAVAVDDFVDYRGACDYAQGIGEVVDSLRGLLKDGRGAEVVELAEYALGEVEGAMGSVDDSGGYLGGIFEQLQELHHAACRKARPEPEALAARLFAWELRTDVDTFLGASETYADVLGKRGLSAYRELAEAEWAKVPALKPGSRDDDRYGGRFRITHIMESLARASGDFDELVAVKSRDLSTPWSFLKVAEACKGAGRDDQALKWAEEGVAAFPDRPDARLRAFVAKEYRERGRHGEAVALAWTNFSDRPGLEVYKELKHFAGAPGQWAGWREKALSFLRDKAAAAKREAAKNRWGWGSRTDHSTLVEILLWERKEDDAWQEAKSGGCSESLWMTLAAKREKDHPEDALAVYQARIDPIVEQKKNPAYEQAFGLLQKIRDLLVRLGRSGDFERYLAEVRAKHKPKRNFMKLLDGAKWSR